MKSLSYSKTPVVKIEDEVFQKAGVEVFIKREDLNHKEVSGNKWWKLKYNLEAAAKNGAKTLITFGGAYSNHIYATAAAGKESGFKTVGFIRGEEHQELNPTLRFAVDQGMELKFISRDAYKRKNEAHFIDTICKQYPDSYIIPEGGTNTFALKGCKEFSETELRSPEFDYLILSAGTGGTTAGILCGLPENKNVIAVSSLKGDFLKNEIDTLASEFSGNRFKNFVLWTDYHQGGYGKVTAELMSFIFRMNNTHQLPLDPIYTGKSFYALYEEVRKGYFSKGSRILFLHTGGLQGSKFYNEKFRAD